METKKHWDRSISDAVGTKSITYTPDQIGNYSFVFSWPGQIAGNGTGLPNPSGLAYVGDYFEPSTSDTVILPVTQEPITSWVEPPIPNRLLDTSDKCRKQRMVSSRKQLVRRQLVGWQLANRRSSTKHTHIYYGQIRSELVRQEESLMPNGQIFRLTLMTMKASSQHQLS